MLKIILLNLLILCTSPSVVFAATAVPNQTASTTVADKNDTHQSTSASSGQSKSNNNTFQLSATKINLGLEQLNDVGLDLKNVLTATRHLYDEVMVQPVTVITEPEMIAAVVINIPIGVEPTGPPKPARKDRVDLMMSQIKPVIDLLKKNADEFMADSQIANFPDDAKEKLDPLFKKWLAYMDDVYGRLLDLEKLTVGPTYNNYAIAETCQLVEKDIKQIDDVRRPIYKILQEEEKKLSK